MRPLATKLFLIVLLVLGLATPASARGQGGSKVGGAKSGPSSSSNHPPVINSFSTPSTSVIIPCPRWAGAASYPGNLTLSLATEAYDPDGDALTYQYFVTGGHIIGEGPKVSWNLTGVGPGPYRVKVIVGDGRGGAASESIDVEALLPGCCLPPCPVVTVMGPEDEVDEGQAITFSANVSGGPPGRGVYLQVVCIVRVNYQRARYADYRGGYGGARRATRGSRGSPLRWVTSR